MTPAALPFVVCPSCGEEPIPFPRPWDEGGSGSSDDHLAGCEISPHGCVSHLEYDPSAHAEVSPHAARDATQGGHPARNALAHAGAPGAGKRPQDAGALGVEMRLQDAQGGCRYRGDADENRDHRCAHG